LGPASKDQHPLPYFYKDCTEPHRGGSLCIAGRRPEVHCKLVLTASEQETPSHIPVLLSTLEDLGCLFHTGSMVAAPKKEARV
jgi:hypothetical protein